jgi:hypothetical protein
MQPKFRPFEKKADFDNVKGKKNRYTYTHRSNYSEH